MSGLRWDKRFQRAAVPRLPRVPGGQAPGKLKTAKVSQPNQDFATDEHGLSLAVTRKMSPLGREYLALAYRFLGLNKRQSPSQQGYHTSGTLPELVALGALLAHGYTPGNHPQGFSFQGVLLGGRVPGGTVADIIVITGSRPVAWYVDSFFHARRNPFGGAAKISQDQIQRQQVLARTFIKAIAVVNDERDGFPLENGPDFLIRAEIARALAA